MYYEKSPQPENMSDEVWAFFNFIFDNFDNDEPEDIGTEKFRYFVYNAQLVRERIKKYVQDKGETIVQDLSDIPEAGYPATWLTATDPEGHVFVVISPEEVLEQTEM